MIFITEILDKCLPTDSSSKNLKDRKIALALANKIANILLRLPTETFDKIESLVLVANKSKNINEVLENEFKQYHIDFNSYDKNGFGYIYERYDDELCEFPDSDLLEHKRLEVKSKTEKLINKVSFVASVSKLDPKKEYISYLPLIKEKSSIIKLSNLFFIQDIEKSRIWKSNWNPEWEDDWKREKLFIFPKEEYLAIKKLLPNKIDKSKAPYRYRHQPFLRQLDTEFNSELMRMKEDKKRKSFFYDGEDLIAQRAVKYYLDKSISSYDLSMGEEEIKAIEGIEAPKSSVADYNFTNLHELQRGLWNRLGKAVTPIEISGAWIAIQGLKTRLEPHLNFYEEIAIPNMDGIQNKLSKLFISMLNEPKKLFGDMRDIHSAIMNNSFSKLLSDVKYLRDLEKVIMGINEVKAIDLLESPAFWMTLKSKIKEFNSKYLEKEEKGVVDKDIWRFVHEKNKIWQIFLNEKQIKIKKPTNAITKLVLIYKHYEVNSGGRLHGTVLQRATLKFENGEYYKDLSTDSKGKKLKGKQSASNHWRGSKDTIKNDLQNPDLTKLIENFIDIDDFIDLNNLDFFEFKIEPEIQDDFFNDLKETKKAYRR